MNDEELNKRFDKLENYIEVLAKTVTDQHLLIIRMMAHQQSHLAVLRGLLERQGVDSGALRQELKATYQKAIQIYHDEYEAYQKSGDVAKLLDHLPAPDDLQSN